MGGGGKGGGSSSSGPSPEQRATQGFFLENVAKPLAGTLIPQILEAFATGGVSSQIPLVQKSVEATRRAASGATAAAETGVARAGLTGTPFGERIRSETKLAGDLAAAGVPFEIVQALMALAPGLIQGGGQISISGPGVSKSRTPGPDLFASLFGAGGQIGGALVSPGGLLNPA